MSWLRTLAVVFLWTMLPGSGWGADMQLGLAGAVEYDDNIYRTSVDKKDDVVFRITPKVEFIEDDGKLQWYLRYQAPWEKAIETERVDGFRHYLTANAGYHLNAHTRFFFNDTFQYSDAIDRVSALSEEGTPTVGTFREPVYRNTAMLGMQHAFTPRLTGNLAFGNRLFRSDLPRRSDAMVYTGNTNLVYALSPQHKLGGGAAVSYQDFDETNGGGVPASQTLFLNMYATWTWTLNETMSFDLTGGPTFVDTNQDAPVPVVQRPVVPYFEDGGVLYAFDFIGCGQVNTYSVFELCRTYVPIINDPALEAAIRAAGDQPVTYQAGEPVPSSRSDSTWTFFGEAQLNKRWSPTLVSSIVYRRTESTASGTGSATLDLVSLLTTWRISELWDVGLRADFTRRKSTGPVTETYTVVQPSSIDNRFAETVLADPAATLTGLTSRLVDRSLDTDRWGVSMRMARRLTKNIDASLRYTYSKQSSRSNTVGSTSDFGNHLVTLGVQYNFNRWHLW